jgi:hypothetical protein
MGLVSLQKRFKWTPLPSCHLSTQLKGTIYEEWTLSVSESTSTLILDLPASRTKSNKFLCCVNDQVYFVMQPEWTEILFWLERVREKNEQSLSSSTAWKAHDESHYCLHYLTLIIIYVEGTSQALVTWGVGGKTESFHSGTFPHLSERSECSCGDGNSC